VATTHALFALKVQRKLSNGVAGLATAGSSLDRAENRGNSRSSNNSIRRSRGSAERLRPPVSIRTDDGWNRNTGSSHHTARQTPGRPWWKTIRPVRINCTAERSPLGSIGARISASVISLPSRPDGSLRVQRLHLPNRIFSRWSSAGYLWRAVMNFQNGYRLSLRRTKSANRTNEPAAGVWNLWADAGVS
jgi:hypothetical protein